MGRPSGLRTRSDVRSLRIELERQIEFGQCAYCRRRARPGWPLTREHLIPRARGGRRKDVRIIVPACIGCNQERGCRDLIPFLLTRPRRISCVLDYLSSLSPASLREVDLRIFAELYTAVKMLRELAFDEQEWHRGRERLCGGRALHRRRYAARRALHIVEARVTSLRERGSHEAGASCALPTALPDVFPLLLDEPVEKLEARLLGLLALSWEVPSAAIEEQLVRALTAPATGRTDEETMDHAEVAAGTDEREVGEDQIGRRRRRLRVDRRNGRAARPQRPMPRGRAA